MLAELNLDIKDARGQCYDGAASMSGQKTGAQTKVKKESPKSLYTHCYGHALNLVVKDSCNKVPALKDAFDTTKEVTIVVKKSPKRETLLKKLRLESGNKSKNVHAFCPTRWTVRG